jgi:hypothetical protein
MSLGEECFKASQLSKQEIYAIQELEAGTASSYNQNLALQAILKKICRVYDTHFLPGHPDATAFLEGRGYCGQQILKYMRLDPQLINKLDGENP